MSAEPVAPSRVRTAVLLTNEMAEETLAAVGACVEAASSTGCVLRASAEEIAKHPEPLAGIERAAPGDGTPDVCIVLGGDGTILRGLREWADTTVPVFGINFGTIGFLAAVDRPELDEGLRRAFSGDFEVMSLPALEAELGGATHVGLNDVSLSRRPHSRVAEISYRLSGEEVGHVRCDGLVAATPAGSTGYNLANNGPILAWGVEGYAVSFIAPHTLTARALVVAPDDVLTATNAGERDSVDLAFDGVLVGSLEPGEAISVRFRDGVSCLAQLPGANFYRRIREKFGRLAH